MSTFRLASFFLISLFLMWQGCGENESEVEIERPHSPWVFRSVLDSMPRMVTLALNEDLWVAYSTERAALYKAWKGNVDFDGAVFTTRHGPQPSTLGNSWLENQFDNPWSVVQGGKASQPEVQYRGHRYIKGHAELHYELKLANGHVIKVSEQPEYITNDGGQTGLERIFTTENVPAEAMVVLKTNLNSIAMKSSFETDGKFEIDSEAERKYKNLLGLDIAGKLTLNANSKTRFAAYFTAKPMIENDNKVVGAEEEEELPLGYRLIAKSDCKTCHNTYLKTVGPAYIDVAKKYSNTPENIATLVTKVKIGGAGVWGESPMTPHPDLADADAQVMVQYIMDLDAEEEAVRASEMAGNTPQSSDFIPAMEGVEEGDLFPGIVAKFYEQNKRIHNLGEVNSSKPTYQAILPVIKLGQSELAELADNTAIFFEGFIKIAADNNFVFRLTSDDGSRMYIDNQLLIDNDGEHGADAIDGEIALSAGYHSFKIEYFQSLGGKMVNLKWRSFSTSEFSIIPPTAFMFHKDKRPQDVVAMGNQGKLPGDRTAVPGLHPSYDLSQARPDDFLPKVGGMDFLSDGRMVVSTWDPTGSVYVLDNVSSGDPTKMTATRIAWGLAEPLGLKVVDDEIYVLQKQELTKLIDHNKDGWIDEYYTLCNDWTTTGNFHEFGFGLVYKDGHFYGNLAIAIQPGGASTQPQAPDRGKTFKISKETGSLEFVTQGLRTPNGIGLGIDNEIFVTDNQGDWLPSSKVLHITPGAFFNSYAVDSNATKDLPIKQPVVWLPQDEIGNSPTTPIELKDGIYAGQMMHGEVTNGGIKRVFVEKIAGEYQGCVFRFIQGLEAGVNRLIWGPDSALYMGGVGNPGNWQNYEKLWYGLQRLEYNEQPTFEMLAIRAKSNGMEIEFTEALPDGIGWNPKDYEVQQWRYLPTKEYGGPKLDEEFLTVRSATVSADRKKVFLELDGLKQQHVVYFRIPNYWTSANNNELWSTEAWYTLNSIPENQAGTVTAAPEPAPMNGLSEAETNAGWKLLFDGKTMNGWRNFRKETIGKSWKIDNGAIMLDVEKKPDGHWQAKDGGDIMTDDTYENFELQLEWKIQPCGNSGIIYNVVESEDYDYVWQTGPEMQVLDNACHPDSKFKTHRAGDLYDMIECKYETVKPAGEWNKVRLVSNNGKVEHWLNGRKVVAFEMFTPKWEEMIANSKFKDMPGFGKARKGHISLQDHGDRVWYRNIKIRKL